VTTPSVLSHTTNLLRLFMYSRGNDEIPPNFYLWSMLCTMAACVRDRVYVKLLADAPIYANLYVLLYGLGGCGKGTAIEACTPLVKELPCVNLYEGALNGPTLFKLLHQIKNHKDPLNGEPIGSKIFLAMEELAMDVGNGKEAAQFVKYLTGLWKPKPGITEKTTIGNGRYELRDRCINFIGGTTRQWIFDVLTAKDMQAGAGRRIIIVEGHVDPDCRVAAPYKTRPPDYEVVMDYIRQRLELLTHWKGEITKTPSAIQWEESWYNTRPGYESEETVPQWRQEPELMNKVAIGLVLADGGAPVMTTKHLLDALKLVQEAQASLPAILEYAKTLDSGLLGEVWHVVRDNPGITWQDMVKKTALLAPRLQGLVSTLQQSGRVFRFVGTDGKARFSANEVYSPKNKKTDFSPDPVMPEMPVIEEGEDAD
jgi:hypothetical protein